MRVADLRQKEVINNCDCKRLGYVEDIIFDCKTGRVESLVIMGPSKLCGLICAEYEYIVPYSCIQKMGEDIIIVKVNEEEVKKKID